MLVGRGKLYACMMRVSGLENILGFLLVCLNVVGLLVE